MRMIAPVSVWPEYRPSRAGGTVLGVEIKDGMQPREFLFR